jgi:NADH:ubiquinone oxidoreductase subunit E
MLLTDHERLADELRALADKHGHERSALIPILQEVQRRHCQIAPYAMQVIADLLGIHPVEVYSVVSFYSFLSGPPKGRFVIRLCRTLSCDLEGKDRVARQLENDLGIPFGQTTLDGKFTLEWANCVGMCDQGPALLVNERVYTRVTPAMAHEILEECRSTFGLHATHREQEHLV